MSATRWWVLVVLLLWAALWAAVLALDADFARVSDWPVLFIALLVLPQLALGYVVGPRALICVLPLAAAWIPLAHADCDRAGAECLGDVAFFAVALEAIFAWALFISLGYGLRLGLARWRNHRASKLRQVGPERRRPQ